MRSDGGGPGTSRARRLMPRARCPRARHSTASRACAQVLLAQPELFVTTLTEKLLTYAVGRELGYTDAPGGARNRARRGRLRLSFLVGHRRNRLEHAVSNAATLRKRAEDVRHEDGASAAHVSARSRRHAGAAAAGCDGAGALRAGENGSAASTAHRLHLYPERRHAEPLDAGSRRRGRSSSHRSSARSSRSATACSW